MISHECEQCALCFVGIRLSALHRNLKTEEPWTLSHFIQITTECNEMQGTRYRCIIHVHSDADVSMVYLSSTA